jgi:hypothetical protein
MTIHHHQMPDRGLERQPTRPRTTPQSYSRQAMSNTIRRSRSESESNAVLIALSIMTCVSAFLLVYGGWRF